MRALILATVTVGMAIGLSGGAQVWAARSTDGKTRYQGQDRIGADDDGSATVTEPAGPKGAQAGAFGSVLNPTNRSLLFTVHRKDATDSAKKTHTTIDVFRDPEGKDAVKIECMTDPSGKLVSYTQDQYQTGEKGRLWVEGDKIHFELTDRQGKVKSSEEKQEGLLNVGLTLRDTIQKHWPELMAGEEVKIRFGVLERLETVGFKLFKDREAKLGAHDTVVIEMKPSSMFISALVDPLYFYFDQKTHSLLEYDGRAIPKKKVGDKFEDLDAVTVY